MPPFVLSEPQNSFLFYIFMLAGLLSVLEMLVKQKKEVEGKMVRN